MVVLLVEAGISPAVGAGHGEAAVARLRALRGLDNIGVAFGIGHVIRGLHEHGEFASGDLVASELSTTWQRSDGRLRHGDSVLSPRKATKDIVRTFECFVNKNAGLSIVGHLLIC